jgi:hypothetical protein
MKKLERIFLLTKIHPDSPVFHGKAHPLPNRRNPYGDLPHTLYRLRRIHKNIIKNFTKTLGIRINPARSELNLNRERGKPFFHLPDHRSDKGSGRKERGKENDGLRKIANVAEKCIDPGYLLYQNPHLTIKPRIECRIFLKKIQPNMEGRKRSPNLMNHQRRKFTQCPQVFKTPKLFEALINQSPKFHLPGTPPPEYV